MQLPKASSIEYADYLIRNLIIIWNSSMIDQCYLIVKPPSTRTSAPLIMPLEFYTRISTDIHAGSRLFQNHLPDKETVQHPQIPPAKQNY